MLHRPGPELKRLTPRNNDKLLFDGIPWVAPGAGRARRVRRRRCATAASRCSTSPTCSPRRSPSEDARDARDRRRRWRGLRPRRHACARYLARLLRDPSPAELTDVPHRRASATTRCAAASAWSPRCSTSDDFLIDPLPNLLFTRDSSVWVRDRVAITIAGDAGAQARDPADRADLHRAPAVRRHAAAIHGWHHEHVEGGDVLLLAPGVIAVGVGERTTPAGVERLARQVFARRASRTPCSPCRSRRSAPPCTSTPSARWSTSTRS